MTKVCFKCGVLQDITEFYSHPHMADGHLNKCKSCTKRGVRERYSLTRAERSAYEQERNQQLARRLAKREYHKKHNLRNPEKYRARTAIKNAVRDGRATRQPCVQCGNPKSQAHHHDYSKPLDVVWMCFKCHREVAHGQVVVITDREAEGTD